MAIEIYNAGEDTTYRLLHEIGSGQEGQTWKAEQHGAEGPVLLVALKVMRPNTWLGAPVDPQEILRMWMAQARLMRNFTHRGFAAVQVAFSAAAVPGREPATPPSMVGLPAFVMGWIEGSPLHEWSAREDDPLARLTVLEQAADGLDAFHRETGHVHRDLKPANIMVEDGRARIVDFGLIRTADRLGTHSIVAGSEPYMDPVLSHERAYSPATDLYSFAGIIYYQLLLEHPVRGRAAPLTHQALAEAGFDRVGMALAYALSPQPSRRPTVGGAVELLERVTEHLQPRRSRAATDRDPVPRREDATTAVQFAPEPVITAPAPVIWRSVVRRIVVSAVAATVFTVVAVLVIRSLHS